MDQTPLIKYKTTTIQISQKTKKFLDDLKDQEQLSSYDAVIRVVLLNYKLYTEFCKEKDKKKDKT
ncbi:hypothetical protein LCGC14_1192010 [marine sediment metagenome]|uniref:Ribbon-helix-helix protein CopG domain-containing protein n=1 Tax=marine sediment metagenome TaxID=412755 RepID=A0A0F9PPF4_9ZZZZ|nr:MAG: hypothetical protein Lokiarch_39200 [Candidatus Lokiarchaeum sp. GC14_75]